MTVLDIVLALPCVDKEGKFEYVECDGLVVRVENANTRNAYNIAIYFSEIKDSEKQKIESFVERYRDLRVREK